MGAAHCSARACEPRSIDRGLRARRARCL